MNITAELHDWEFNPSLNVYWGLIINDRKERWYNGTYIHTSYVESVVEAEDHFIVVTLNSTYKLPKDKKLKKQMGFTHEVPKNSKSSSYDIRPPVKERSDKVRKDIHHMVHVSTEG